MKISRDSNGKKVSTWMALVVVFFILAGAVALQYSIDGSTDHRAGSDDSSPFEMARSVLDILGGIRESLAANLWTKTDTVFHEYMEGSVVRDTGIFPYYWLITRLDPHFTMSYYYASWMLARFGKVDEGFDLALEGVRYNPDSAVLQDNLASIYFFFKKDPKKARYHILKAIEFATDEQDKLIYRTFLGVIDDVIAGKRAIPEVVPLEEVNRLNKEMEEHEHGHKHED